ncbi:hypothetical protein GCM10009624_29790 [Gordonia sinesedis]
MNPGRVPRSISRTAALAGTGTAVLAIATLTATTAFADTALRLPGGTANGEGFSVTRSNERALISPALAANGASRTVWVSADITLRAPKLEPQKAGPSEGAEGEKERPGSNGTSTSGAAATLSTGYVVGCQVNIEGLQGGLSGTLSTTAPSATGTFSIPIKAGEVSFVSVGTKDIEKPGTYHVTYNRVQLTVNNCAGYAQARAYTTVETNGKVHQKISLYGKPFSIG